MFSGNDVIATAIRELRTVYGESQQAFATRLGISIASLANYEIAKRRPHEEMLVRFYHAAIKVGRRDLAMAFLHAFYEVIRLTPLGPYEWLRRMHAALTELACNDEYSHLREPLEQLLAPVLADHEKKKREKKKS